MAKKVQKKHAANGVNASGEAEDAVMWTVQSCRLGIGMTLSVNCIKMLNFYAPFTILAREKKTRSLFYSFLACALAH